MQNRKPLYLLFTANAISGVAQGMSMLSIPWYFTSTGQTQVFNLFYGALTFMALFWGLYAGTLIDRYPRKRVFLATNMLEGTLILSIALLGLTTTLSSTWLVPLVFAVTMFGYYMHYPNMYAFIQEITHAEDYGKATSAIEIVGQSTTIIAGGCTAILLEGFQIQMPWLGLVQMAPWSIYHIFLLDAATYFIAFALIASLRYVPVRVCVPETGSLALRLSGGFAYLRQHSEVLQFGLLSYVVFMALLVELNTLLPLYVKQQLKEGAAAFGIAEMCYAAGALFSGLFARRLFSSFTLTASVVGFLSIASVAFLLPAFTTSAVAFYVWSFFIGLGNAGARIYRLTWLFRKVPNERIGRVNSIFSMVNVIGRTLLIFLFSTSFFQVSNNVTYGYLLLGLLIALSVAILLWHYRRFQSV
jgi:MFS family permease